MGRGSSAQDGETRVSKNGYHYTKTGGRWRLTHHIVAEKHILKRPLQPNEMVRFKGSKRDLRPQNLEVIKKGVASLRSRLAVVEARIEELEAERDQILNELKISKSAS